jgi:hypothetical protein
MKRLAGLTTIGLLTMALTLPLLAQPARRLAAHGFASDEQTIPVMANTNGFGGAKFQTYVTLLNPTSSAFPVVATLHDGTGATKTATINLAAGELQTYDNFLDAVFHSTGGGAVTFRAPDSTGGTHNNRFIVTAEVWTATGGKYSTPVPAVEFAGTSSPSFSAGVTVDAQTRTNVGCFNQSGVANHVRARVFDRTGHQALGTVDLNLAANGWGQTPVNAIVGGGYIEFVPEEAAVCYAVVVDNGTNDGRFVPAVEYRP